MEGSTVSDVGFHGRTDASTKRKLPEAAAYKLNRFHTY